MKTTRVTKKTPTNSLHFKYKFIYILSSLKSVFIYFTTILVGSKAGAQI